MWWTSERFDSLKRFLAKGLSASRIAQELGNGVSRNAVIGKIHRMGLAMGRPKEMKEQPARPKREARRAAIIKFKPSAPLPATASAPPTPGAISLHPVMLVDLALGLCRWPLGPMHARAEFFCGDPSLESKSYCPYHYEVSRGGSAYANAVFAQEAAE